MVNDDDNLARNFVDTVHTCTRICNRAVGVGQAHQPKKKKNGARCRVDLFPAHGWAENKITPRIWQLSMSKWLSSFDQRKCLPFQSDSIVQKVRGGVSAKSQLLLLRRLNAK